MECSFLGNGKASTADGLLFRTGRGQKRRNSSIDELPEGHISLVELKVCEHHITFQNGVNLLVKYSSKYIRNNRNEISPIDAFAFSNTENFGLLNTHLLNGNIDVIYGYIIVSSTFVLLFLTDKTQSVLLNFKPPNSDLNKINNEDKITLGDYNGQFKIFWKSNMPLDDFEDSGSVVKIVPSPTQKALYALENAITRISNKDKNIDEFHEAVTQKTSNHPSGLDNSIHDLETQINNDLFKSPVIPQKYHQNKTSSIKRTKLFSDHSTTLNSSDLLSLEDFESENLLTNYESPFRENNTFKICKASSSSFKKHKSNIGTLPNSLSVRNISDNYCNDKSRDYEEPQSAFTRISNVNKHLEINKEKSKISSKSNEKKDYSAAYTNCDATILKKYASKYGDNKQKSNASAYDIPTQIIFEKPNVKRASVNELNPFDVPTQKIVPDKPVIPSKSVSPFLERTKNAQIESNNRNVSNDPFLALTQKIPQEKVNSHLIINNSKVSPIKTVNKEDIEKSNVPIDTVTADPFDVPTQVIVSEKSNQIDDKLEKSVILDPFDAPTQICSGKHAESENFNTSSPFIVPVKEFSLKNNQSHTKNLKKSNIFLNKYEKVSKTINSENDEDIPLSEFFRNRNQKNSVSPTSGEKDNSTNHAINVDASLDKEVLLINSSNHELKKTDSVQNNYYNSTMDIENDLLTQPTNAESKSIVPIEVIENNIQSLGIPKEKKNDSNMKENYYVCTQELENDLLSQATTSTPKPIEKIPFKIPKKNSFRTIESRNRPSSPDDFYGCRAVDTPTLKQNCIPSKDVVLAPLEDEIESSSEDVVTPIAYKRKIPKKKLKTTNTKSDVGQLVLKVTLDKMQSQKTLTSKNNESNLAENNLLKNVPSSSKEKLTNDNDLSVNASSNNTVMDTSMSYDPFENYTDPSKPENMSLSLQNNYCENKRKRRTSSFQSTYNVMFSRFRPNELQRFENIIIDLGGNVVNDEGNVLVLQKVSRSFKSLKWASLGVPLVSAKWLSDSYQCSRFLDHMDYVFTDEPYKFIYPPRYFLTGWTIYSTPGITMPFPDLKTIVEVNGGICIQKRNAWEEFPKVYPGDKVFTVFTIADEDIAMTLPTPRVDINTFCTMVLKQELDFDT